MKGQTDVRANRGFHSNVLRLGVAIVAVGLATWLVRAPRSGPPPAPPKEYDAPLPALYGLAMQADRTSDLVARYDKALQEIVELGANCVLLSTSFYQPHAGSEKIDYHPDHTPGADELAELVRRARSLDLRVVLMPKVLLATPRGNEWRGKIQPPSWDVWFDRYRECVLDVARAAASGNADVLIVGSELISTEKFTERWRRLIRDVRRVFDGRLAYSANWDHYKDIAFWDDLDLIGLTTYYKLADEPGASVETLVGNWEPIKNKILSWQRTRGRPIIFTEVGWCSQEGAAVEAWNYYRTHKATPAGLQEQKNCYEAFIRTWDGVPAVGGVIWWEWTVYPGGPDDINYTPRGKPAEKVLRRWFASQRKLAGQETAFVQQGAGEEPADSTEDTSE